MWKCRKDMTSLRSHRMHGYPKKGNEVHQAPKAQIQGFEVKTRHCSCLRNLRPDQKRKDHHTFEEDPKCRLKGGRAEE
jgi:hypothetical protein